jgi:hypothetical protein
MFFYGSGVVLVLFAYKVYGQITEKVGSAVKAVLFYHFVDELSQFIIDSKIYSLHTTFHLNTTGRTLPVSFLVVKSVRVIPGC